MAVRYRNCSPDSGVRWGSTETLCATSLSSAAVISRTSLCRMVGNPPNGQEREWSMEVAFPHTQDDGSLRRSQPYLKQRPSRNSPFDNAKPYLRNGRQVSHAEAPFSLASSTDRTRCRGAPSSKPAITALCDSRVVWRMEFLRLRRRCSSSPRCCSLFLIRFTKPDVMRTEDWCC